MRQRPPPSSMSCDPFHQTIFRRVCRLSVGCCVPPSTGSHRKSRPHRSLFFIFMSLYSTPPNDGKTSSPTRSALSHRLSNVPPSTEIITRLVVMFLHRMAATQDRCSVHLSLFAGCHCGAPIKLFRKSEPEPVRRVPAMVVQGAAAP
jgi:hypothetical protein